MRTPHSSGAAVALALLFLPISVTPADAESLTAPDARIAPNDNRRSAGTLREGVLTVRIDARDGTWRPEGPNGPSIAVAAFAEAGKTATTPGPLLRVPLGAEIRATVRNTLGTTLWMYGLGAR